MNWTSWVARAGARLSWQVIYPVQIYGQVEAAAKFGDGVCYAYYNDYLVNMGKGHDYGVVGFFFGIKVSF